MQRQLKPASTVTEQIQLLDSRGMSLDPKTASHWLTYVSYYRLSAYWYPARELDSHECRGDQFTPGTTLKSVTDLYEADRKLRTLVHDGMERVKIALRTCLITTMCGTTPEPHRDPKFFRPTFDLNGWLATANRRIERSSRRNDAIRHYQDNYDGRFPLWVLAEVLDFSDVSKLLQGLHSAQQQEVCETLGFRIDPGKLSPNQAKKLKKEHPLVRWMEQLTVVRNTCAHHGRLWNQYFTPAPTNALRTIPGCDALPVGQSERVFGALIMMAALLRATSPGTKWPNRVVSLLQESFLPNPLVQYTALGIPEDWDGTL